MDVKDENLNLVAQTLLSDPDHRLLQQSWRQFLQATATAGSYNIDFAKHMENVRMISYPTYCPYNPDNVQSEYGSSYLGQQCIPGWYNSSF